MSAAAARLAAAPRSRVRMARTGAPRPPAAAPQLAPASTTRSSTRGSTRCRACSSVRPPRVRRQPHDASGATPRLPRPRSLPAARRGVALVADAARSATTRLATRRSAARADAAIAAIEAWTTRKPTRAEAWFYLGGAYGARAQWRVLRGERLAAARDGKRIKEALERALALDPELQDAYFGIGLYQYYADVAPTGAKVLRWLLASARRRQGAGPATDAARTARRPAAPRRSRLPAAPDLSAGTNSSRSGRWSCCARLHDEHPRNPHFPQRIAEVEDVYLHDHAASLRHGARLLEAARGRQVAEPAMTEVRARLGVAPQLDQLFETRRRDRSPAHHRGCEAGRAGRRRGSGTAAARPGARPHRPPRRGCRGLPRSACRRRRRAIRDVTARARAGIRRSPHAEQALAYRLSLEGWRALERGASPTRRGPSRIAGTASRRSGHPLSPGAAPRGAATSTGRTRDVRERR